MIIKDIPGDPNYLDIHMPLHNVIVSKQNAFQNFEQYLAKIRQEFEHEFTRTTFPQLNLPPTQHHLLVND